MLFQLFKFKYSQFKLASLISSANELVELLWSDEYRLLDSDRRDSRSASTIFSCSANDGGGPFT